MNSIWLKITEWFKDRSERNKLVLSFNEVARNSFVAGIAPTYLKASISRGCSEYRHSFSKWLSSGFRIKVFSGAQLSKQQIIDIGNTILADEILIRRLVVLGWDTLEIHCDEGNYGCRWQLKDFLQIGEGGII